MEVNLFALDNYPCFVERKMKTLSIDPKCRQDYTSNMPNVHERVFAYKTGTRCVPTPVRMV
jgi:hypothetical protein